MPYPQVIATSVVRSSHQGESHGGVYVVDLETERFEQVVDWNTTEIEWLGRGHDRGLRGIAFWRDHIVIAASDAVLLYDRHFELVASFRNPYLRHCHEIARDGDRLWLTSTGFDALLVLDLARGSFTAGWCLRVGPLGHLHRKLTPRFVPRARRFDPQGDHGPKPGDTVHLNMVAVHGGAVLCSGTRLDHQLRLGGDRWTPHARIPRRTHNVQPYRGGVLMHHTAEDRVVHSDLDGTVREHWPLPRYDEARLDHADLPADHARQAFGRGLCLGGDGEIIAGSSPSTISVFRHGSPTPERLVTLSLDVRNAIHGLEVLRR